MSQQKFFVSAHHASAGGPIYIPIYIISVSFSRAFVNACHALRERSTILFHAVSQVHHVVSVTCLLQLLLCQALNHVGLEVQHFFRNIPKLSRPLNSGIIVNVPMLKGWAGVSPMGAAVADAVAQPLLSIMMRSNLSSPQSVHPSSAFWKFPYLASAIFYKVLQKTRTSRSPNSRKS